MPDGDNFLDQHLEYIGKHLYGTLGPTRIGPKRHWKAAHTLRSMKIIMIAITAYANMIHTPITIHSMSTASSSGINDVSSECTHWVTILKSNII